MTYDFKTQNVSHTNFVFEKTFKDNETLKASINNNLDIGLVHKRPVYGL